MKHTENQEDTRRGPPKPRHGTPTSKLIEIAKGLAAWLTFEAKCGRRLLFCESYLKYPLAQLLKFQLLPGKVRHEREHPVLTKCKPGHKYSVDYVVLRSEEGRNSQWKLAIEAKWACGRSKLPYDLFKDAVRLSLLVPRYTGCAALIMAGKRQDLDKLFDHRILRTSSGSGTKTSSLPMVKGQKKKLRLKSIARNRQDAYFKTMTDYFEGVDLPVAFGLRFIGRWPLDPGQGNYGVCVWSIAQEDVSTATFEVGGKKEGKGTGEGECAEIS